MEAKLKQQSQLLTTHSNCQLLQNGMTSTAQENKAFKQIDAAIHTMIHDFPIRDTEY
jgi:sulfur transfer complex TusBCD TusB component (DsrH family)